MAASLPRKYVLLLYSTEAFFICVLMFMVTWGMAVSERNIAGYAHTKAQIERVWTECTKSCYKVGEIVFQREQDGRSIACRAQVRPGSRVEGEVIDIALEPNSCYGPTILGGPSTSFMPLMILFGASAVVAFGLMFVGYRQAFGPAKTNQA